MANNKVQLADGTTLIDLTSDTVTPQTMLAGITAHGANGEQITGVVNLANAGDAIPLADDDAGSVGTSTDYAREDHVHPFNVNDTVISTLADLVKKQQFFRTDADIPLGNTGVTLEAYARGIVIVSKNFNETRTGCLLAVGYSGKIYSAFIDAGSVVRAQITDIASITNSINSKLSGYGALDSQQFDTNNEWTPTKNGIAHIVIGWDTSGGDGYFYVRDTTSNINICLLSTTDANGLSLTGSFAAIAGHTYKNTDSNHVNSKYIQFVPFQ